MNKPASQAPASTPTPDAPPIGRPGVPFLLAHPAHCLALGFGSGLSPVAPGTVGTLWAWLAFVVLDPWMSSRGPGWGFTLLVSLLLGWAACRRTAQDAGVTDPGYIVWDEVLAFWLVLWLITPAGLVWQTVAFALFRFFDAAKPGPVRWADRRFKGGGWRGAFGILFDDLVAAGCTLMVLALLLRLWPSLRSW